MTIKGAQFVFEVIKGSTLKTVTFSGTVTLSGSGVARNIIAYKKNTYTIPYETVSDGSTGEWSLDVTGGSNDEFLIICIGEAGENSVVFDHVVE